MFGGQGQFIRTAMGEQPERDHLRIRQVLGIWQKTSPTIVKGIVRSKPCRIKFVPD